MDAEFEYFVHLLYMMISYIFLATEEQVGTFRKDDNKMDDGYISRRNTKEIAET